MSEIAFGGEIRLRRVKYFPSENVSEGCRLVPLRLRLALFLRGAYYLQESFVLKVISPEDKILRDILQGTATRRPLLSWILRKYQSCGTIKFMENR